MSDYSNVDYYVKDYDASLIKTFTVDLRVKSRLTKTFTINLIVAYSGNVLYSIRDTLQTRKQVRDALQSR